MKAEVIVKEKANPKATFIKGNLVQSISSGKIALVIKDNDNKTFTGFIFKPDSCSKSFQEELVKEYWKQFFGEVALNVD